MKKWLAIAAVCAVAVPLVALGGIEGTMEYALDAPWRVEPYVNGEGRVEYGSIPIQVSLHDVELINLDPPSIADAMAEGVIFRLDNRFTQFCSLTVEEKTPTATRRRHFDLDDFAEIEKGGRWRSKTSLPPAHRVCRPDEASDGCEGMRGLWDTAEWHATAWYAPATRVSGSNVPLTLTAQVTKSGVTCSAAGPSDVVTLRNHVTVHLGEAPLPRFDNRWLLGDLHYHGQGTDNEGESAYNYRGVIRAMGALGLDFVFAAEHASNSPQIIDADIKHSWCGVEGRINSQALRDMSIERFRFLNGEVLHGAAGVNRTTALAGPGGRFPQGYLSHRAIPQIFLGGELDAIPETETDERYIPYGNGLLFDTRELFNGWESSARWCTFPAAPLQREEAANGWLVKDVQGLNYLDYGREHLIYLPRVGTNINAFVASNTGLYGGAARRLAEPHGDDDTGLLPEIERKGYAFLAHPLNSGSGDQGPDGPPWSEFMIRKAWKSRAVLGLQFWNEPTHLTTAMRSGNAREEGYEFQGNFFDRQGNVAEYQRLGFIRRRFELLPYYSSVRRSFQTWETGVERQLHHGAYLWDQWLLRGLDTFETNQLPWLPAGQPRRFFMAAGSDAHGDLNYRRDGYFLGTGKIKDVAIAKARNLVFAGDPTLPRDENIRPEWAGKPAERHSHDQIVRALVSGNFAATDGPALRVVVDRNQNGAIDDGDTPMGGVVELNGEQLPLLVEWKSTEEFGGVTRLSVYVGVHNDQGSVDGGFRVYAPARHGPRNTASLPGADVVETYQQGGCTHARMEDHYWRDPTGLLSIDLATPSMGGKRPIVLPLAAFEAGRNERGDRFYVRVFAETERQNENACVSSSALRREGACIRHYAFTNPIWAIVKAPPPWKSPASAGACQLGPRR